MIRFFISSISITFLVGILFGTLILINPNYDPSKLHPIAFIVSIFLSGLALGIGFIGTLKLFN